jgi:hypothetical protein
MTPEAVLWVKTHSLLILLGIFIVSAILLQIAISFFKINIFKPIVLGGHLCPGHGLCRQ